MKQKELTNITSLRGIAAIFIVVHHFSIYLLPEINSFISKYTPFISKNYIWVDFFFILSGFILAYVYHSNFESQVLKPDYIRYVKLRFARIYPLHLFMLLCFLCLESAEYIHFQLAAGPDSHQFLPFAEKQSIPTFFINLFLLQTFINGTFWNQPAWSISAEWVVYIFLPFVLPMIYRIKWLGNIGLIMLSFFILFILHSQYDKLDLSPPLSLIRCICEATLGIILYRCYKENYLVDILSKDFATNLLFAASFLSLFFYVSHILTVVIFTLLILSAAYNENSSFLSNKFLIFSGTISYSVYMTHWFIQTLLQKISKVVTGNNFSDNFNYLFLPIVLLLCVYLVIKTSALTYKFIENPSRKWFRSVNKK